jgi:hypothetical protein
MLRGRPLDNAVRKTKYNLEFEDSKWYFDDEKNQNGAWKVEQILPSGKRTRKIEIEKSKPYGKLPVVMVFKTSNRSNARTKMKIWNNQNIDYILTSPKLPGVPPKAKILEVGVGISFINEYRKKYNLT